MKFFIVLLALIACCTAQLGAYQALTATQAKGNAQVQALIKLGLNKVIAAGQAKNQFKNTQFSVTKINSAYQQVVSGGNNYKLDVNYINTAKEAVRATFTGFYDTTSKTGKIITFSYKVQYPTVAVTPTTTTPTTTPTTSTPTTSTPTTTSTTPTVNQPTAVDVAQLQTDQLLNNLFQFGFNTAVQNGIAAKGLPNTPFSVSKVNSITRQAVKDGSLYTFNCLAKNAAGTTIALAFIVRNQVDTYSYKIQGAA